MEQKHEQLVYEKWVSCFFHANREVPCMGYKYGYAQDLVALREKEAQLMKDQMDVF